MQAGEWYKNFHQVDFRKQDYFFLAWLCLRPATLLKKRLWHRSFFCKFSKISKSTCFYRTPPVVASERKSLLWNLLRTCILFWLCYKGISSFIHRISNNYFTNPQLFFRLDKIENDQILLNFKFGLIGIFLFRLSLL